MCYFNNIPRQGWHPSQEVEPANVALSASKIIAQLLLPSGMANILQHYSSTGSMRA